MHLYHHIFKNTILFSKKGPHASLIKFRAKSNFFFFSQFSAKKRVSTTCSKSTSLFLKNKCNRFLKVRTKVGLMVPSRDGRRGGVDPFLCVTDSRTHSSLINRPEFIGFSNLMLKLVNSKSGG